MGSSQPPTDFPIRLGDQESRPPGIAALATNYRQLVCWVGLQVILSFAVLMVPPSFRFLLSLTVVPIMFYAYRTAKSLGSMSGTLCAVAMMIPFVNILTLLVLSSKASAVCRANGIEVGLFGPRIP